MYKILLVDDHAVVREGIAAILMANLSCPVCCDHAGSLQEAESMLSQGEYNILLLDVSLPGANGLDFLDKLHRQRPTLRVLVVSMHSEEQYAMRALSLGAAGYLTKESASEELVAAVSRIIDGGRYISSFLADRLADYIFSGKQACLPHETLSKRECQVLCMIGAGKTPKQIGSELHISDKTVSTYRTRILQKMGMNSTAEMMNYAIRHMRI